MSDFLSLNKGEFEGIMEFLKKDLSGLRIGRATPALVAEVPVEAYGAISSLNQLAGITVTDPKTLSIQPWDKSILKAVETALFKADLGTSLVVRENVIMVSLPPLTEETRLSLVKKIHARGEEARVAVKTVREKIKIAVITDEKDKAISEDDKFKRLEDLDALVKNYNNLIKETCEKKEQEIKQI